MHSENINLPGILRSAMVRAGLVKGWVHKCRWCGHRSEEVRDARVRRCPSAGCGKKLWPAPVRRSERFHDLRHTTATLLLKLGTPLAMVQRLVGHSDQAITTEVYKHLKAEDVRPHLERLAFDLPMAVNDSRGAPVVRNEFNGDLESHSRGGLSESLRTLVMLSESTKNKSPVPRPSSCGRFIVSYQWLFRLP